MSRNQQHPSKPVKKYSIHLEAFRKERYQRHSPLWGVVQKRGSSANCPSLGGGGGQAQCARSATIWASSRTRDPYFQILGAPRGIIGPPLFKRRASSCTVTRAIPRGTMGRLSTTDCTYLPTYLLELGQFGSSNSKGVSKGCAWGAL